MNKSCWFVAVACISFATFSASAQLPRFTELVKHATPSVVNISATRNKPAASDRFRNEQLPEFFRRFAPPQRPPGPAAGSGFIISSEGYILTNNHVVEGADEIIVALSDRRERKAELVGADPISDLALLKIEAEDLPAVEIGSSKDLEVGEWVVAIGSPFGFEHSVTQGIVSAKGRSLPYDNDSNYVPFIQTDVAINPGNSGGPLFNLEGKVVGINSQIFTRSGGYMGLSFSIPIDVAMEVVEQLKEKGVVSRGWLGVGIQPVNRDLAEAFGLDRPSGALVGEVFADSPAEAAGIKVGDIILEFDGKMIDLSSDLPHIVGRTSADSLASVLIVREGERKTLSVKVGRREDGDVPVRGSTSVPGNRIGIEVQDLSRDDENRLGVEQGVVVVRVSQGSGRRAGIQRGDVITTINSQWIASSEEFETLIQELEVNVAVPIRIVRNKRPQFLAIKIVQ
jgi:serine protease Do